jgi:predicted phosphodiesterase
MRLAIFSDVHGNLIALEAVLADIEATGPFEQIVFGGDAGSGGPHVHECIERIRKIPNILAVYGNADERLVREIEIPDYILENPTWLAMWDEANAWARARTTSEDIAYLAALPYELRLSPTGDPADDLLIVHASPLSVTKGIYPPEAEQLKIWGEVVQSDQVALERLNGTTAGYIALGHFHIPSVRYINDVMLINVSSVSRPEIRADWQAKWAILTFIDGRWQVEHRRVSYDHQAALRACEEAGLPFIEEEASFLLALRRKST